MRFALVALAGVSAISLSSVAGAQQPADATVDSYLCTFAGKCGADAAAPAATKAAPDTKGFRLAAAQAATPTTAAPETKSFRLARSAPVTKPVAATVAPMPMARAPRRMAAAAPMPARMARPAIAPTAAAGTRANLMLAFEYNSDRMTPAAQGKAKTFAQALLAPELKDKRFLIAGHTDSRGARALNVDLSRRRAQSVADFLIEQGVDRSRVEVKGVGPDEPLAGHTPDAEANRRVEAVLLS